MTKRIFSLALIASVLIGGVGCSSISRGARRSRHQTPMAFDKWKEYKAPDATFSVFFPSEPRLENKSGKASNLNGYTARNKSEAYYVSCSSAADDEVAAMRDKDANLLTRRGNLLASQQKAITAYGEPARELTWEADGRNYRGIIVKTHQGHHIYTLWARWRGAEPGNVPKFFDSFKPGSYTPKPVASATPLAEDKELGACEDDEESSVSSAGDDDEEESDKG